MALFAYWQDGAARPPAVPIHRRLLAEAHIVPETTLARRFDSGADQPAWHLAAFATTTRYYPADRQIWCDPAGRGACVIHGLLWRAVDGRPRLLDAAAVAALLDRPGRVLPADVAGEYAVARLHDCGTLTAFGDRAALHHLFHAGGGAAPIVANRAGFVAAIRQDWRTDAETLRWLPAIGYRVGAGSGWRAAAMVPQESLLIADATGLALRPMPDPVVAFPERRGFDAADGSALLAEGLAQARAAIHLATDRDDRVALPITGGKDSRAVLALCLSAGLGDRLTLFTRGYEGHPDVVAGRVIAAACGLPHERQSPLGSDQPALWSAATLLENLAAQAFQTDGMMGGWDFILGRTTGTDTLLTGHMGEVLKAYSKRPLPDGALDPVAMVRLQAPFDPLGLLRPEARVAMVDVLAAQMARATDEGARPGDQPDIFYYRNRIPNWLGGIRGIKAFERQPVMPLGVPALLRLAFRLTPEERQMELAHHAIVHAAAPALLAPAFALQTWDARLRARDPALAIADPVTAPPGAPPVFGNWQYSLNHVPAIRRAIADLADATDDPLMAMIDRDALRDRLRHRSFNYFDGISLLGLVAALLHARGLVVPLRMAAPGDAPPVMPPARPVAALPAAAVPTLHGHLDRLRGPVTPVADGWRLADEAAAPILCDGWLHAPDHPAAHIALEARIDGHAVASAIADRPRADLARAGLGDGTHGFALALDPAVLRTTAAGRAAIEIALTAFGSDGFVPIGGRFRLYLTP